MGSQTPRRRPRSPRAKDGAKFHSDFASAFSKVTNTGYKSLQTCSPVGRKLEKGHVTCASSGVVITFGANACECNGKPCKPPSKGVCSLVGGFGMRGKIQCGRWVGMCASSI